MNKLNIYQIEQSYIALAESIIENEGIVSEEQFEALQITQEQLEVKGRGYAYIIKDLENDMLVIDKEIERLEILSVSRKRTAERLKATLSDAMQLFQIDKLETPTLKISFRSSESVDVPELSLLDGKFVVEKTSYTADKVKIKAAIKAGETVVGATLKINSNIQIK